MKNTRFTRRIFLKGSAAAASVALVPATLRAAGANNDIRVALVGFRGRGTSLLGEVRKNESVRVVAFCDVDKKILDREMSKSKKDTKENAVAYTDLRKLLESKEIDAIVTATPNHWHALATIWACQAGKDVYVEKPVCHNIWEGRRMIDAADKYKRIVQSGTQRRSDLAFHELVADLRGGALGKIHYVRTLCYRDRNSIGKVSAPTPIPPEVNYDLWCGPAKSGPLMRKELHYDWHWVWDTGNADLGNQGIHEVDQARWILGYDTLAPRVMSVGGRFLWNDDGETPNQHIAWWDYPTPIITEVRNLRRKANDTAMDAYKGTRVGVYVHCENGYYTGGENGGFTYDHKGGKIKQYVQNGSGLHTNNFFKAVRSRNTKDLNAPLLEGFLSSSLCHQANISHRLGQQMSAEEVTEHVKSNKVLADTWAAFHEQLKKNNVDLTKEKPTYGAPLTMDVKTEQFTGPLADKANPLLTRNYRAPYSIPATIAQL